MTNGTNGNGSTNGVHRDAAIVNGHDLLWDGLPPAVTNALEQPLDPALVSRRKGQGQPPLHLRRGPHRHRPGQRDIRLRRLGT